MAATALTAVCSEATCASSADRSSAGFAAWSAAISAWIAKAAVLQPGDAGLDGRDVGVDLVLL